jgi:hypothetical protein
MAKSSTDTAVADARQGTRKTNEETLFTWIVSVGVAGVKSIPKQIQTLAIQIGVVVLVQLVFWWQAINKLIPAFISGPVIFLTATYNDVIPKTLYWVIFFTFGKKLVNRIRETGFAKAMRPILWLVPELKKAYTSLKTKAYPMLMAGLGTGLIIANNFASYSRFSQARNKFDKYFIALVISFTISYLLGEGRKHWLFKFGRLSASDFARWFKYENRYTDNHTYILLSGFVLGLLADAPLIAMKMMYGGYILGLVALIGAVVLAFQGKAAKPKI